MGRGSISMISIKNTSLCTINGKHLLDPDKKEILILKILENALLQEPKSIDPLRNWKLAGKINDCKDKFECGDIEFDFILELIKKSEASPLIRGQVLEILNDSKFDSVNKEKKEK